MNDLVPTIQNRTLPEKWDYDESVEKVKGLINKWKDMTIEWLDEVWQAHDVLDGRDGRNLPSLNLKNFKFKQKTFGQYCNAIGITHATALNWLKKYDPILKIIKTEEHRELLDSENRNIVPYGKNIYFMAKKFYDSRKDGYKYIADGEMIPTLKNNSWFYHRDTGVEYNLREYAEVQTFPEEFIFVGTYATIKEQIGNAVAPQMAEYIGKRLKGKTFGDLFAGCGGLSYGLKQAGKIPVWAIEKKAKHRMTYISNHAETDFKVKDIEKANPEEFKKVDIIVGGPPCQGFSLSGKRFKDDERNILYKEFLRFVEYLKPKEFLMENVPQIQDIKEQIIKDFNDIGYAVETELIKGEEIGMRQKRHRFFFIGKLNA